MRRLLVAFFIQITMAFCGVAHVYAYAPDQVPVVGDTIKKAAKDSVGGDSLQNAKLEELKKQSDLEAQITYKAADYMLLDMDTKVLYLSEQGELKYQEMTLKADSVVVNWENNRLTAGGKVDTTGQIRGRPQFDENGQTYNSQGIIYNFKTQKGIVEGARTKQGEEYVLAGRVKKVNENTYYIQDGKFTSCELEHPHYYIKSKRLKVIPRDKIITGPVQLVIEEFPLPLILPFGFFPNQTGKRSGLVMPTYGESAERGYFLRNGGYYWAISDYVDLMVQGDVFSKGGYRLAVNTSYNKRYRFSGTFGAEYGFQKFGLKEDPGYRTESNFKVQWMHNQTITPQATLKSDVNVISSNFYSANSYNEQEYLTNTLRSSINYNQAFANTPWRFNMTLDHSQNTLTKQVVLGLPNITVNRTRFFPFKGRNATGDKWYYKIGANYTMNLRNQISAPDSIIPDLLLRPTQDVELVEIREGTPTDDTITTVRRGLDYFKNGVTHTIPISTQFNALKYINITPSINFREYWHIKTIEKVWDPDSMVVLTADRYGFATARDFSFNFGTSTRVYGIFALGGKRQTAIRHTMQPGLSYTFKPDFANDLWGYFRDVQTDTAGTVQRYSRFEGTLMGGPTAGEQQTVTFNLGNVLEMKYRSKEAEQDTSIKDPYTRLNLLDAFGVGAAYNFAADSLNLSLINFNARTNILNNMFSLNWDASFDPYAVNQYGQRINTFRYEKNGTIARFADMGLSLNLRLQSKRSTGLTEKEKEKVVPEDEWRDLQYYRDLYVDFNIPWTLNVITNLNYVNTGISRDTTITLNFNGDFNLTPKWKIGFTSGYDFANEDFSYTSVSIYRDLHCWEMSMTWIPFGNRKSYNFSLNVKSSTLKDLKLTKRRDWQDRF